MFYNSPQTPGCMLRSKSKSLWSGYKVSRVLHVTVSFHTKWELRKHEWHVYRWISTKNIESKTEKMNGVRKMCNGVLKTIHDPKWTTALVHSVISLPVWPSLCSIHWFNQNMSVYHAVSPTWGFEKETQFLALWNLLSISCVHHFFLHGLEDVLTKNKKQNFDI